MHARLSSSHPEPASPCGSAARVLGPLSITFPTTPSAVSLPTTSTSLQPPGLGRALLAAGKGRVGVGWGAQGIQDTPHIRSRRDAHGLQVSQDLPLCPPHRVTLHWKPGRPPHLIYGPRMYTIQSPSDPDCSQHTRNTGLSFTAGYGLCVCTQDNPNTHSWRLSLMSLTLTPSPSPQYRVSTRVGQHQTEI